MAQGTATPSDGPVSAPAPLDLGENIEDVVSDAPEFLGEIVVDESVNGDYGPQWHYAVRPLLYTLQTPTGAYHEYVPTDPNKRGKQTKFGIIIRGMYLALGDQKPSRIGGGDLIGFQGVFRNVTHSFGKDRETKQPIETQFLMFIRTLNDADKAELAGAGQVVSQTPSASSMTDEDADAILNVIDGQTEDSAVPAAAKSKLAPNLKSAVVSGVAIPALISQGKLRLADDGKYHRVTADSE